MFKYFNSLYLIEIAAMPLLAIVGDLTKNIMQSLISHDITMLKILGS